MNRPVVLGAAALLALMPARAHAQTFPSSAGPIAVTTVARGLVEPWSLAFLPDGRMLVTEKPGRMRIVTRDGALSPPLGGLPAVHAAGQSGLLDVRLDNDHANNHVLYFCYSLDAGGVAAVARARLDDGAKPRLNDVKVIFRQQGPGGANNYGCRIVQAPDGNLFVTLGDHFGPRDQAQNLANHIGKLVRIRPDGSAPPDNPFVGRRDAKPEIWAYGVRNPQGLAFDPATGKLWEQEHGPRGGDEVNIIEKGRNYGWPVIGYGIDYNGAKIHESTHKAGMEQPLWHWVPSIAPSGMAFYTGDLFPSWKGNLFIGALAAALLVRLERDGDEITKEERLLRGLRERIRDVRQGPDGALWLLTDNPNGRILRLAPVNR
ncbi:MAG TPA: PQQ-dependent sugar dehydrogenase [Xanthobacteraceae bacterium]|jgi:glucose/arabinose dehydrogenase|nr:PQQ-dependent sugar dehydrogenase [Xanthobacteraceae bacterium]